MKYEVPVHKLRVQGPRAAAYLVGLVSKEVDLIKVTLHELQAVCLVPALQRTRARWQDQMTAYERAEQRAGSKAATATEPQSAPDDGCK